MIVLVVEREVWLQTMSPLALFVGWKFFGVSGELVNDSTSEENN